MAQQKPAYARPKLHNLLMYSGLAFIGVILILNSSSNPRYFQHYQTIPLMWVGVAMMWLGQGMRLYTLWQSGNKDEVRQSAFRLLLLLATVGLLAILSVILGW